MNLSPISAALAPYKTALIVIAGLIVVGALLYYRHTLIQQGEDKVALAEFQTTEKLRARNAKDLAAQHAVDMTNLNALELQYDADVTKFSATSADLNQRLRAYASASRSGLAHAGDPATSAGPDVPAGIPGSVERAIEGVNIAAAHDAAKVIGLQTYVLKECH